MLLLLFLFLLLLLLLSFDVVDRSPWSDLAGTVALHRFGLLPMPSSVMARPVGRFVVLRHPRRWAVLARFVFSSRNSYRNARKMFGRDKNDSFLLGSKLGQRAFFHYFSDGSIINPCGLSLC